MLAPPYTCARARTPLPAVARFATHTDTLPTGPPAKGEQLTAGHVGTMPTPKTPEQERAEAGVTPSARVVHEDTLSKRRALAEPKERVQYTPENYVGPTPP